MDLSQDRVQNECAVLAVQLKRLKNYSTSSVAQKGKGKGKGHCRTGHEGPEGEWRYSSTLSLTSALDGVAGQRQAPAALRPEKTRYSLYERLGGPQGQSGWVRNSQKGNIFFSTLMQAIWTGSHIIVRINMKGLQIFRFL